MTPQCTPRFSKVPRKYANAIRSYRIARGLAQKDIAASLGVARHTISAWERGLSCPTPPILMRLARELSTLSEHLYPEYFWPKGHAAANNSQTA